MSKIIIRLAKEDDIAPLYQLWEKLVEEEAATLHFHGPYPMIDTHDEHTMTGFTEGMARFLYQKGSVIIVAEEENKLIGYVKAILHERVVGEPKFYIFVQEAYTLPEQRTNLRVIQGLDAALESWIDDVADSAGIEISTKEMVAVSSPDQINKWRRKNWVPYGVLMWKEN